MLTALTVSAHAQVSKMESEYLRLAGRFEERAAGIQNDLRNYLKEFPYTTYESEVHYMAGVVQAERGFYKQALKDLEQADPKALSRRHVPPYLFYRGYSHLMQQEYKQAETLFGQLSRQESEYKTRAQYYAAYAMYKQQKYDKALPRFAELESNTEFRKTVPYFIVQCHYQLGNTDEVRTRAEALLAANPNDPNSGELNRILGELNYADGRYREAADCLTRYATSFREQGVELVRNDLYLLGMAQYKTEKYQEAVTTLKQVKLQSDSISESVCMTMGNAYVHLGQMEQAKLSYRGAMQNSVTPRVREEAMYNYALCAYESSTALGESVTAFTDFLNAYPHSEHVDRVYSLMCDAFLSGKNYQAALSALDSVVRPNARMLETKQYLRFKLGTDAFVQGNMERTRQWMTDVVKGAKTDDKYLTEALYWRAEAAYRLRQYADAETDLTTYFGRPDVRRSPNLLAAHYLSGYVYFTQKNYDKAKTEFRYYIDRAASSDVTYADALNRLGDCAFNARQFDEAVRNYDRVTELNAAGADYATFQTGYARGLQRRYADKVDIMQRLVSRYPKSDYADDGLYEKARALLQLDRQKDAIVAYEQLLKLYPHSNMARKACVERAMLYRNSGDMDKAIAAYKQTIATYPASEEAYTALEGLEAIYVETNRINEYLAYTKQLGRLNMSVSTREDSLCYAAAELQYMLGNYTQAAAGLTTYLSQYCPGGRNCVVAQYYCADAYYRLGKNKEALAAYRQLSEMSGNPYMAEACTRVAELSYDNHDYATALDYFYRMLQLASGREQTDVARLGILRCSYNLGRNQATIDIAGQILEDEPVAEDVRVEALYNRAKAFCSEKQYGQAIVDFTPISREVRTAVGAESKFLLADCYYRLKALDNAEQEIMSFASQQTQQQYWLARALVLLSDINVDRGDDFQAEQYLLTLQRNYTREDDIHTLVAERLAAIADRQTEKLD